MGIGAAPSPQEVGFTVSHPTQYKAVLKGIAADFKAIGVTFVNAAAGENTAGLADGRYAVLRHDIEQLRLELLEMKNGKPSLGRETVLKIELAEHEEGHENLNNQAVRITIDKNNTYFSHISEIIKDAQKRYSPRPAIHFMSLEQFGVFCETVKRHLSGKGQVTLFERSTGSVPESSGQQVLLLSQGKKQLRIAKADIRGQDVKLFLNREVPELEAAVLAEVMNTPRFSSANGVALGACHSVRRPQFDLSKPDKYAHSYYDDIGQMARLNMLGKQTGKTHWYKRAAKARITEYKNTKTASDHDAMTAELNYLRGDDLVGAFNDAYDIFCYERQQADTGVKPPLPAMKPQKEPKPSAPTPEEILKRAANMFAPASKRGR